MSRDGGSPSEAGIVPPILVARRTSAWKGGLGSAACRGGGCTASTAVGAGRSGSWQRQLMDFVVAPYLQLLRLARRAGMSVECTPEKSLSGRMVGCLRSRTWEWPTTRSWRLVDLVPEDIAQQMLDLRRNPQKKVQERLDRANSNLSAGSPFAVRP
jgi:hypothetical protein